jgi:hypothetical protein
MVGPTAERELQFLRRHKDLAPSSRTSWQSPAGSALELFQPKFAGWGFSSAPTGGARRIDIGDSRPFAAASRVKIIFYNLSSGPVRRRRSRRNAVGNDGRSSPASPRRNLTMGFTRSRSRKRGGYLLRLDWSVPGDSPLSMEPDRGCGRCSPRMSGRSFAMAGNLARIARRGPVEMVLLACSIAFVTLVTVLTWHF